MFFVSRPGAWEPRLGNYLGELTNELDPSDGNHIAEFTSSGAKSYGYVTDTGHTESTVKGFTFSHNTESLLNFDAIKKIVCQDNSKEIQIPQLRFILNKYKWNIKTVDQIKKFRFTYDKRVVLEDFSTLPYGY